MHERVVVTGPRRASRLDVLDDLDAGL